jgi:hypothetical protein
VPRAAAHAHITKRKEKARRFRRSRFPASPI